MELLLQSENTMATLLPTACSENLCVLGGWLIAVLETGQQQANDRVGCMAFRKRLSSNSREFLRCRNPRPAEICTLNLLLVSA